MPPTSPTRKTTFTQPPKPTKPTTLTRIANYTVFTFLSIILLCLIVLTPADAIYQCYITSRLTNIFIITGGYVVTFLLAVLIYATRIYTNRSVLGGIPKAWIPVEKEDVGKSVRRLVVEGLGRSALVAGGARPRSLNVGSSGGGGATGRSRTQTLTQAPAQAHALADVGEERGDGEQDGLLRAFDFDIDPANPPWGVIEHPGWSAPESSLSANAPQPGSGQGTGSGSGTGDAAPSLCYRTVIRELPHLIEAKAVSLAPPDPVLTVPPNHNQSYTNADEGALRVPDTRIVAILRRPVTMSLRSYINHLISLSIINPPETGLEFVSLYERARFSGRELFEDEFRTMMGVFADVLRGMRFDVEGQRNLLDGDSEFDTDMDMRDTYTYTFGSRSESVIGPSDEEGETETDTLGSVNVHSPSPYAHAYGYGYGDRHGHGHGHGHEREHEQESQYTSGTGLDGASASASTATHGQTRDTLGLGPNTDGLRSRTQVPTQNQTSSSTQWPPPPPSPSPLQHEISVRNPSGPGRSVSRPPATPMARTPSVSASSHYSSLRPVRTRSSGSGSGSGSTSGFASARSLGSVSRSASSGGASGSASGTGSGSGGSVIRLADARTESVSGLPYVLGGDRRGS